MAKVSLKLMQYAASRNKKVEKVFDDFCMELARCGIPFNLLPKDDIFSFDKYPVLSKVVEKITKKYRDRLQTLMSKSLSGAINLAMGVLKAQFAPYSQFTDYILDQHRKSFVAAFLDYRMKPAKGMSLSDRVWNYTSQTKSEFELALSQVLEDGIRSGESAEEIGRKVRDKLRNPDMMYRRYHRKKILKNGKKKDIVEWRRKVVDPDGTVHFIKEDLAKVGTGVYRSARQNALRMSGTEISMAYRYGEVKELQKEPFVLGYKICLSTTNHTCKDGDTVIDPYHDMCDDLAGDYPKWFMWSGWHPRCRCHIESILCSEDEMRYISRLPKEQYEKYKSPNLIKEMPANYNDYMAANQDRVERSVANGKQPYWIEDNYVDGDPSKGFKETPPEEPTTLEKAKERQASRTKAQIEAIQKRWDERKETIKNAEIAANTALSDAEKYPLDIDSSKLKDLVKRRQFLQTDTVAVDIETQVSDLDYRLSALNYIPNADQWVKTHPMATIERDERYLERLDNHIFKLSFEDQRDRLKMELAYPTDEVEQAGLEDMLKKVELKIKLNDFRVRYDKLKDLYGNNHITVFDSVYDTIGSLIGGRDESTFGDIERLLNILEQVYPLLKRYEDLLTFNAGKSKPFAAAMDNARKALDMVNIPDAVKYISEAETRRAQIIRDRNWAAKQAAKNKKEPEPQAEPESEEKKKTLSECKSWDEEVEVKGGVDKMPKLLQGYKHAISRMNYTKQEYQQKADEINKKMRVLLMEKTEWAHATDVSINSLLDKGVMTYMQAVSSTDYYSQNRYESAHFFAGLVDRNGQSVDKKDRLKPGEYYRCGVPISKNLTEGYKQRARGYGNTIIIWDKDKVCATFTFGNSLGQDTIPSLCCAPEVCSFDNYYFDAVDDANYNDPRKTARGANCGYIELQFYPEAGETKLGLEHAKAIVMPRHPEQYASKTDLAKLYDMGVDVYYWDDNTQSVVLYKEGKHEKDDSEYDATERAKILARVDKLLANRVPENKDINYSTLETFAGSSKDYWKIEKECEKVENAIKETNRIDLKCVGLLPNVATLHNDFTNAEIEGAYDHCLEQFAKWKSEGPVEHQLKKIDFEITFISDPKHQSHNTWPIALEIYQVKRVEVAAQVRFEEIKKEIDTIENGKYKGNPDIAAITKKIKAAISNTSVQEAEDLLAKLKDLVAWLDANGQRGHGEAKAVKFDDAAYSKKRMKDALWFKDEDDHQKGWNEADKYLSPYAQEAWSKMTDEEKKVAWYYTDGGRYINDRLSGLYYHGRMDTIRPDYASDINTLTDVIAKAPELKDDMWVQCVMLKSTFESNFGIKLKQTKTQSAAAGTEATINYFLSTSAAKYSFFSDNKKVLAVNREIMEVIMNLYLPKGTKGMYCEPFASYGDGTDSRGRKVNTYGVDGLNWSGQNRQDEGRQAGDQVEFLLQRGAKIKINSISFNGTDGKWYVDASLVEQTSVDTFVATKY